MSGMHVLQVGPEDWAKKYQIPKGLSWEYNGFPLPWKRGHRYGLVIITGRAHFTTELWKKLQWLVDPYNVLYLPGVEEVLDPAGKLFLKCQAATKITDDPQTLINDIPKKYYYGQSGIRVSPNNLVINLPAFPDVEYPDGYHVRVHIDSDQWQTVGTYKVTPFVDPGKCLKVWQECTQAPNLDARLVIYNLEGNGDQRFTFPINSENHEVVVPMPIADYARFIGVSVQVKGHGQMEIGTFHYRWARFGAGNYFAGGQRIIDPHTNEEIAYYFNPGDLRPPLNVYFAGARSAEGFEAYPLFRYTKTPSLLFTDPRLQMGQFYTGDYLEQQMMEKIKWAAQKLGFTMADVVTHGLSMGTYPALKLGSQLGVHAINVGKDIANLGYLAERARWQRPFGFDTALDVASRNVDQLTTDSLHQLDKDFWDTINHTDLTKTKIFLAYMLNDDYDNHAIHDLNHSVAVQKGKQFVYKGFAGRHNDATDVVVGWFVARLYGLMYKDFGRKEGE